MKTLLIILGLGVLAVLVGTLFVGGQSNLSLFPPTSSSSNQTNTLAGSTEQPTAYTPPKVPALTYEEAINLYKNARIQFDSLCHANPASLHVKNGSGVLLDNRSTSTLAIFVEGARYSLGAYGFRVVRLSHASLPYTAHIDCGSGKNTAEVLLQ